MSAGAKTSIERSRRTALRVVAVVCSILLAIFLSIHFDWPAHRSSEAPGMVRAEFGAQAEDNYVTVSGFLQRVVCYYRFVASSADVQKYVDEMELVQLANDSELLGPFLNAAPYWWRPERNDSTRFYGFRANARRALWPAACVLSWDQASGTCHIRRVGG